MHSALKIQLTEKQVFRERNEKLLVVFLGQMEKTSQIKKIWLRLESFDEKASKLN
jgi:hypothetical protein